MEEVLSANMALRSIHAHLVVVQHSANTALDGQDATNAAARSYVSMAVVKTNAQSVKERPSVSTTSGDQTVLNAVAVKCVSMGQ